MIKRWIIWPLLFLLLLAALVSLAFATLVFTEVGSRWALQQASPYVPGHLSIAKSEGNFWQGLKLTELRYHNEQMAIYLEEGTLAFDWKQLWRSRLHLSQLELNHFYIALLPYEGEPKPEKPPFHPDELPSLWLPFTTRIVNAEVNQMRFTTATGTPFAVEHIQLAASTSLRNLRVRELHIATAEQSISLHGTMGLQQPFALDAQLNWQSQLPQAIASLSAHQAPAQGALRVTGPLAQLEAQHELKAPISMHTQASVEPFATPLRFSMEHTWQPFALHLKNEDLPELPIDAGIIRLNGDLNSYQLVATTSSRMRWQDRLLPHLGLSLLAQGDAEQLHVEQLRLGLGNNQSALEASGQVAWLPQVSWDLALNAERLNPQLLMPELDGELSATASSQGQISDIGPSVGLIIHRLEGRWLAQDFAGKGNASLQANGTAQAEFAMDVGNNHIAINGRSSKALDWRLALNVNNFTELWPTAHGQAEGRLHLVGTTNNPLLSGEINANELGIDALSIHKLGLHLSTEGEVQNPKVALQLHGVGLTQGENTLLDDMVVEAKGTLAQHQANWSLNLADHHHQGAINGTLSDTNLWRGTLSQFNFNGPMSGAWQLENPVAIQASAELAKLEDFCLRHNTGQVCAALDWQIQGPTLAELAINAMPLAVLNAFMPDSAARLEGELNFNGHYQQSAQGNAKADAQLTISPGHVALDSGVADEPYTVEWRGLTAEATLDQENFSSFLRFDISDDTGIEGNLKGSLTGPIKGHYWMQMDELAWLEIISPEIRELTGQVSADLHIGGTLKDFTLKGNVSANSVSVAIPQAGLELTGGELNATAAVGEPIKISGKIHSGEGVLNLTGEVPTTGDFPRPITGKVSGTNFLAVHTPDANVIVNPDIEMQLIGADLILRGQVVVPEAHITPKQLPVQAVRVSADEYIISEEEVLRSLFKRDVKLTLILGDKVSVDGFGLKARFAGSVQIEERSNRSTRLNGSISIEEGRFRAYGQDLRVERGNLIFQGPPNNPGLDIVAYRLVPAYNVKAGLILGGTLLDPRSRVFSEPDMDETEAMAFLLTGKPLEGGDDTDAAAIIQAIAIYGIEKGEFITNRVSDTLGIDVGVDTEGEFEETALVLGKQLSSRLYLRYSIGLFEALNTVMLRYTVSRHVNLETRSNVQEQSIDLIYRRER